MKLKDFSVGQTVYVLSGKHISEWTVKTVGRKYITVTAGANWDEKFEVLDERDNFLVDAREWGDRGYLFTSREDIHDFLECKELQRKLSCNAYTWIKALPLEQLRAVAAIIEGTGFKL